MAIAGFKYDGGGPCGCSGLLDPNWKTPPIPNDTTNPKDLIGVKKVPLGLLPNTARIYGAMAMKNGAVKYGPFNWRAKKVKYTIYLDAIERHLLALRDGEDCASDSKVHHLGHIIASAAIILDAKDSNTLIDDRPVGGPTAKLLTEFEESK